MVIEQKTKKEEKKYLPFELFSKSLLNRLLLQRTNKVSQLSLLQKTNKVFFFLASFWISFFRMLVGLEHGILICVSMELQRRSGSQSESEISIGKYGVCVLGFVCVCVCVCVDKRLGVFYRNAFNESESSKRTVRYFKELIVGKFFYDVLKTLVYGLFLYS